MPRRVEPPLSELTHLRQPLTEGEQRVLLWLLEVLPGRWEIYIQPHLNGLRPDFVLLDPKCGIAVYEVKDWSLDRMDYFVQEGTQSRVPRLMGKRDGRTFSLASSDPVAKVEQYKREIYDLYVPGLQLGRGLGAIVAGIIFTNASTSRAADLLEPLRNAAGHLQHPRLYPVIGSDLIGETSERALRDLLSSASRYDDRMSATVADQLRHWLVEPTFSSEQRVPLAKLMTPGQRAVCLNEDGVRFRRMKGPAGSGKSMVIAGRAAELAKLDKRVLLVTYNITLINYLLDLTVQYAQSGRVRSQITALNFHHWCRRVAYLAGTLNEYDSLWGACPAGDTQAATSILEHSLPSSAAMWAAALTPESRWDAILVDEAQDFMPGWWLALRAALSDCAPEGMLAADAHQNVYGVKPWTDAEMKGAGFRGPWKTLAHSFRMSPALCRLAADFVGRFLPDAADHRPASPEGEFEFRTVLRWHQVDPASDSAGLCVEGLMRILEDSASDPVAVSDLVCIVDREEVGRDVVLLLNKKKIKVLHTFGHGDTLREVQEDSRRRKLAFYKGDARVKVTSIQSFKGWESRALVVQISRAASPESLALDYAAITRLKRDDHGCYLTVVCSAPELAEFGATWPSGTV